MFGILYEIESIRSATNSNRNGPLKIDRELIGDLISSTGTEFTRWNYQIKGERRSRVWTRGQILCRCASATGLQYNRARWYDVNVGRWVSEDPIAFEAGDSNIARYVGNNSVNATDASGLSAYIRGLDIPPFELDPPVDFPFPLPKIDPPVYGPEPPPFFEPYELPPYPPASENFPYELQLPTWPPRPRPRLELDPPFDPTQSPVGHWPIDRPELPVIIEFPDPPSWLDNRVEQFNKLYTIDFFDGHVTGTWKPTGIDYDPRDPENREIQDLFPNGVKIKFEFVR